jgi:hypothetical protein
MPQSTYHVWERTGLWLLSLEENVHIEDLCVEGKNNIKLELNEMG